MKLRKQSPRYVYPQCNRIRRLQKYYTEEQIPFLDELLSDKDFYQFMDDLYFHVENLHEVQENQEKVQKKYKGLNIEGYFNWSLQTEVQEFIRKELVKLGLQIEAE